MSKILEYIVQGNLTFARIVANGGLQAGDTVYVNTNTAPTPSGKHIMKLTVDKINKTDKSFTTKEQEPYFGYNRFKFSDIVG